MTNLFARILIVVKAKLNHKLKSFKLILLKCGLKTTYEVVKLFVYFKLMFEDIIWDYISFKRIGVRVIFVLQLYHYQAHSHIVLIKESLPTKLSQSKLKH